ncbi:MULTISPECIES: hypothetical protein [Streptosporangium]|uniref:Uncharacterized protein n=1 Tax=Streptosporangium brasiliense TaxID=47480 RepID=A0ABT9RFM3_9ACTN|nr:hypothetical protein [Streptosporangium brasiliense]MDP9867155.1 hypothetical protein [Streptosporangium brasiliense]
MAGGVGLFALSAQHGTPVTADFGYFAVKAAQGQPVVPSGPFTLRADGAWPYLSTGGDGGVRASATPPATGLAVTPEDRGDGQLALKDPGGAGCLHVHTDGSLRVGTAGTGLFRLTDAGGGRVRPVEHRGRPRGETRVTVPPGDARGRRPAQRAAPPAVGVRTPGPP